MSTETITWDDEAFVDIGHGVAITPMLDEDGARIGLVERHQCPVNERLQHGYIPFADNGRLGAGGPRWTVEQDDPLTISPSVLTGCCELHGWIRAGAWVPA